MNKLKLNESQTKSWSSTFLSTLQVATISSWLIHINVVEMCCHVLQHLESTIHIYSLMKSHYDIHCRFVIIIIILYWWIYPFFSHLGAVKPILDSYTTLMQICNSFLPLTSALNYLVQHV